MLTGFHPLTDGKMKPLSTSMDQYHQLFVYDQYDIWVKWFAMADCVANDSVGNGSNPLVGFRVKVGTRTEPLQQVLPHEIPDCCNWACFPTKHQAFQLHNFGSN